MSKFMKLKTASLPGAQKIPTLSSFSGSSPSPHISPSVTASLSSSESSADVASDTRAKFMRNMSMFNKNKDSEDQKEESTEPPVLDPVYIVLRPLDLTQAPQTVLKGIGHIVKDFEFENYLLLQQWGVLIGNRYYHLHFDYETQKISLSMVPFTDSEGHEQHTIKFPIWRTSISHDERIGIAVGVIKAMGNYKSEVEVEITDEEGKLITSPDVREQYRMDGRYRKTLSSLSLFEGKYGALTNNWIHFTRHYVFEQILTRKEDLKYFSKNTRWLLSQWREMGCRRSPMELTKFWNEFLYINPFSMTPQKSAKVLIKLLSLFLNIDYNPVLDKNVLGDSAAADKGLEEVFDKSLGNCAETAEDA